MKRAKLKIKKRNNKRLSIVLLVLTVSIGLSYVTYYNKPYIESFIREVIYYPVKQFVNDKEFLGDVFNEELTKENKELRELLEISESVSSFDYVNATVITRNTSYFLSFFTINKGSSSGISEGMAVITSGGLIGVIDSVTNDTAVVRMITSSDSRNKVSVKIDSSKGTTTTIMSVDDNKKMVALGIAKNTDIKKRDKVMTSGLSDIFPAGILVGYVENIIDDEYKTGKKVYIELSSDIDNIRYVAVLKRGVYD